MKLIFLICLLCIAINAGEKAENPKETIAVNTLQAIGISKDEAEVLTAKLRSELMNVAGFKVLERGQMEEILKEQQFQASGTCTESECLIEMGQLLGVTHMAAGTIGKVGNTYSVNVRLFSVKTGEILREVAHTHDGSIDDLLKTEMTIVVKKLARMKIEEKKDRTWMWITIGAVAAVGATATAALLLIKDDDKTTKDEFDLTVRW